MRRALIRKSDGLVIKVLAERQRRIEQMDRDIGPRLRVDSPPAGYEDDHYRIVEIAAAPAVPDGLRAISTEIAFDASSGKAVETRTLEARPVAPERTDAEKLARLAVDYELTVEGLRAALLAGPGEGGR